MLDMEAIVVAARARTGLSEWGEPDITEGLQVVLDALNREAELRPDGIEAQRQAWTNVIVNRLRISDILARSPEIRQEKILGPIVILGLPRTGTTKLHRTLAAHPGTQGLPLWRLLNPAPLEPVPSGGEDPRITIAEMVSNGMRDNHPVMFAGHPMLAREPDEEAWMFDLVTRGWMPNYVGHVPSYVAWADQQDMGVWFDYLKALLQMFQWEDGSQGKTWLLKAPDNMGMLDALVARFPDAVFVQTHRDPVTAIPSIAAVTTAGRRMYTDAPQPHELGRFALEHWSGKLLCLLDERERLGSSHVFIDVPYNEIKNDVLSVIERVCAASGLRLADGDWDPMRDWESDNAQHKHGRNLYTLEEFGLDQQEIDAAFAAYHERFGALT
jgi:Sulfotransferase family